MKPRSTPRPPARNRRSSNVSRDSDEIVQVREALAAVQRELARVTARANELEFAGSERAAAERESLRKLLHDGLGQILTSATFLASGLHQRLATLGLPEREIVEELILLLNQAIGESRTIAARCAPADAPHAGAPLKR